METVYSADGTKLAFDRCGEGPPVIMVVGAFNTRETTAPLARASLRASPSSTMIAAAGATAATPSPTPSNARSKISTRYFGSRRVGVGFRLFVRCRTGTQGRRVRPGNHQPGALRATVPLRRQLSAASDGSGGSPRRVGGRGPPW